MKWGAYIRVSSDEQAEHGTSIVTQQEIIEKTMGKDNIVPFIDNGYSGYSLNRPALQKLIEAIERKQIDGVVVYRTDRLSRNLANIVQLVLEKWKDVPFKSITEPYDSTTPAGRMFFAQLASFADFERESIRMRMREGKSKRISEGKYTGGNAPFGYRIGDNKTLVIDDEEKKIFLMFVDWYLNEKIGLHKVSDRLNALKIPTRFAAKGKKKRNYKWNEGTLRRILRNGQQTGFYCVQNKKVSIPAIIDSKIYAKILNKLKEQTYNRPQHKFFYLLKGLIFCPRCGSPMHGKIDLRRSWAVYLCSKKRHSEYNMRDYCNSKNVPINFIENLVWKNIEAWFLNPKALLEACEDKYFQDSVQDLTLVNEKEQIEKMLMEKERQINIVLDRYTTSEALDMRDVDTILIKVKKEKKILEENLKALQEKLSAMSITKDNTIELEAFLKGIGKNIKELSLEDKVRFLRKLGVRVIPRYEELTKEFDVDIQINLPVYARESTPHDYCLTGIQRQGKERNY